MTIQRWQTPDDRKQLLLELVSWNSISLTEGERQFPFKLVTKLQDLKYFQNHSENLRLHDAGQRRKILTALYKHPQATDTICFISHYDTVHIEEYGDLEAIATRPEELTKVLMKRKNDLSKEVRKDLESNEYLFGRGTMDMKMGLVLHMSLIEKASIEKWPINLLLVTVPDEEVNSAGMRSAVPVLQQLQKEFKLTYQLFLNSEPVFSQEPNDSNHYIYTGSIGKILPAALFYGKETHAGEPLSGMTSPYIASFLTQEMEFNDQFQETDLGETTPLPVTLQQKDLREQYSTQTPFRSSALYNVFTMKRNASEVMDLFEQTARIAATKCNTRYEQLCKTHNVNAIGKIEVIRYQDLLNYATKKLGIAFIDEVKAGIYDHEEWDDREKSLRIADQLMIHCQELAPAIIILIAPPYYPSVNSSGNKLVESCVTLAIQKASQKFNLPMKRIHYFNGISDLSYVNFDGSDEGWNAFEENTPVWGDGYYIPFKEMQELQAPVLNIGPFGKDAHKKQERLHMQNAFKVIPEILEEIVQMMY